MKKNMEGNKQWKRVPFSIELAMKIQSGEIEGRIVTSENLLVRIVDFNFKDKTDSIVYIGTYANGEQEFIQTCDNEGKSFGADVLFIELPEESPKQKGELTLGKCKEGDEVWIYSNYEYGPEYVKVKVGKFSLDTSSGHRRNVTFDNGFTCQELTSSICWYKNPITFHTDIPNGHAEIHGDTISFVNEEIPDITTSEGFHRAFNKHEFKPFDKVLVRDNSEDKWVPDIFRYYDDNYPKDYPYRCCANDYKQCIPYTGNEHLVGTTDNPKEE